MSNAPRNELAHQVLDAVTSLRQAGLLDPRLADRLLVATANAHGSVSLSEALPDILAAAGADAASGFRVEGALVALAAHPRAAAAPIAPPAPLRPSASAPRPTAAAAPVVSPPRASTPAPRDRPDAALGSRFDLTHIAYYIGAMCVLAGLGWGLVSAWEASGGLFLAVVATAYGIAFALGGERLWQREETRHPAGILWALAVGMVPLVVYGIQRKLGFWPGGKPGDSLNYRSYYELVNSRWLPMELATLAAGWAVARRRAIPFLGYPVAQALWFLGMDGLALLGIDRFDQVSCALIGIAMLLLAILVDRRVRVDMAFWFHLAAALTLIAGLRVLDSNPLNAVGALALFGIAAATKRQSYAVVGGIGLWVYVGTLCISTFKNSMIFPVVLVAVGIGSIALGIWYQGHRDSLLESVRAWLPPELRLDLPTR
ncbi:MAG: hypothetical protein ABIY52_18565 [Gemmatimonadaceae bacterium]